MNKLLTIIVGTLLFFITACDSGGDDDGCNFNGEWEGITSTASYSIECGEMADVSEENFDCNKVSISGGTATFNDCACADANPDECIEEESADCDGNTLILLDGPECIKNGNIATCVLNEAMLDIDEDCMLTITMLFEKD